LPSEAQLKVLATSRLTISSWDRFRAQKTSQKQDFDFQNYRLIKAAAANYIHSPSIEQKQSVFLPDTAYLTGFSPLDNLYRYHYMCSVSHGVNVTIEFIKTSKKVIFFRILGRKG